MRCDVDDFKNLFSVAVKVAKSIGKACGIGTDLMNSIAAANVIAAINGNILAFASADLYILYIDNSTHNDCGSFESKNTAGSLTFAAKICHRHEYSSGIQSDWIRPACLDGCIFFLKVNYGYLLCIMLA